jgi:hypothetical protein
MSGEVRTYILRDVAVTGKTARPGESLLFTLTFSTFTLSDYARSD